MAYDENVWGKNKMYTDENYIFQEKEDRMYSRFVYVGTEKTVHVPAELENDNGCFQDNEAIEEIIYTSGNKVIGGYSRCSNLKKIYFSDTIEKFLGYSSFCFYDCDNLTEIEVDPANPFFRSEAGMMFSKDGIKLLHCVPGISGKVVVPENVKEIAESAFHNCKKITEIVLPAELKVIGDSAFCGCSSLQNISIPENIHILPYDCFTLCQSLESVDLSNITCLEFKAFSGCRKLNITVPANVIKIEDDVFAGCEPGKIQFEEGAGSSWSGNVFGYSVKAEKELHPYPNLPLHLIAKSAVKQWLAMGFCTEPDAYSGYIRKQYEQYAKAQKKRILKKAQENGYDKVLAYYGETLAEKTAGGVDGSEEVYSLNMTEAEAKKLFTYSRRKTGISINEFKGIFATWNSPGNYDSHFLSGVSNWLVLPETIDGTAVGHIAHTMLPDDAVIICSALVFQKLNRPVKISTSCAYLEEPDKFPPEEAEEIRKFIKKYSSDIVEKLLPAASVQALTRFTETAKITSDLCDEMLEKVTDKPEMTAIILDLKAGNKTGKKTRKTVETDVFSEMLSLDEKPLPVSELKKMWSYSLYEDENYPGEKLVALRWYKGNKTSVTVPAKFGKSRLGRIEGALLEDKDDVSSLSLPDGDYKIDITLKNCRKLADSEGFIIVRAGNRFILTDYIGDGNAVIIPENVTEIIRFEKCFGKDGTVVIPEGIQRVRVRNNDWVKRILLPETVTEIEKEAFYSCKHLQEIIFSFKTEKIGDRAFEFCKSLKEINIPEGAISIGEEAFFFCEDLKTVYIPASVQKIGKRAFSGTAAEIHGTAESYAQQFAAENNLPFVEE